MKRTVLAVVAGAVAVGSVATAVLTRPSCRTPAGDAPCLLVARVLPDGGEAMPRALAAGEIAPADAVAGRGCTEVECP